MPSYKQHQEFYVWTARCNDQCKLDTDTLTAKSNVTLYQDSRKIYIETVANIFTNIVVFDNDASVQWQSNHKCKKDELILEDLAFEQYEITATANQTVFGSVAR